MILPIKKLSPKIGNEIPAPAYASTGAAGMDLRACMDEAVTLAPGQRQLIPTGLAIAVPEGYAALIYARSGLAVKSGITLSNCVGVIDSDYRGELCVGLINLSDTAFTVNPGDRIAQLVLTPVMQAELLFTDELDETARGAGGFGSTGLK